MTPESARIKPTLAAWMAGFVDGEGCLTIARQIRKNRPSPAYRPSLTVSNTDESVLEVFRQNFGGVLYRIPENRRNGRSNKKWADSYTWYCPHLQCERFLKTIKPYLRLKSAQADLLLEFLRTKKQFARGKRQPGKRGGSAPLLQDEIDHRERMRIAVQRMNTKSPRNFSES